MAIRYVVKRFTNTLVPTDVVGSAKLTIVCDGDTLPKSSRSYKSPNRNLRVLTYEHIVQRIYDHFSKAHPKIITWWWCLDHNDDKSNVTVYVWSQSGTNLWPLMPTHLDRELLNHIIKGTHSVSILKTYESMYNKGMDLYTYGMLTFFLTGDDGLLNRAESARLNPWVTRTLHVACGNFERADWRDMSDRLRLNFAAPVSRPCVGVYDLLKLARTKKQQLRVLCYAAKNVFHIRHLNHIYICKNPESVMQVLMNTPESHLPRMLTKMTDTDDIWRLAYAWHRSGIGYLKYLPLIRLILAPLSEAMLSNIVVECTEPRNMTFIGVEFGRCAFDVSRHPTLLAKHALGAIRRTCNANSKTSFHGYLMKIIEYLGPLQVEQFPKCNTAIRFAKYYSLLQSRSMQSQHFLRMSGMTALRLGCTSKGLLMLFHKFNGTGKYRHLHNYIKETEDPRDFYKASPRLLRGLPQWWPSMAERLFYWLLVGQKKKIPPELCMLIATMVIPASKAGDWVYTNVTKDGEIHHTVDALKEIAQSRRCSCTIYL